MMLTRPMTQPTVSLWARRPKAWPTASHGRRLGSFRLSRHWSVTLESGLRRTHVPAPHLSGLPRLLEPDLVAVLDDGMFFEGGLFFRIVGAKMGATAFPPGKGASGDEQGHGVDVAQAEPVQSGF